MTTYTDPDTGEVLVTVWSGALQRRGLAPCLSCVEWRRDDSAAERLYAAYLRGDDLDGVLNEIEMTRRATDPRRLLMGDR